MASEEQTLHLGLVLAGAVSAGAYSAGVADFLIEALDAWEAGRRAGEAVPDHRVVLDVMTGASAGGMTAAIAAVALNSQFEPMRRIGPDSSPGKRNRLYDCWVKQIDIRRLLGLGDLTKGGGEPTVASLLDATELQHIGMSALEVERPGPERPYVADPLEVLLTVSNLRGVPYSFRLFGSKEREYGMLCHADHVAFSVQRRGSGEQRSGIPLDPGNLPDGGWPELVEAALATGAFPIGLQARTLKRSKGDYLDRFPDTTPHFPDDLADPFSFVSVDGGMIDNEPLELARRVLRRRLDKTGRGEELGSHAVLLVDPFPNELWYDPAFTPEHRLSRVAPRILSALVNQARFKPEELAAAAEPTVFTRFMIAPSTEGSPNKPDIASGILGGFGGFLSEDYRRHDFQLGRRNCQRFLSRHLRLPREAALFAGWRDALPERELVSLAISENGTEYLPIIPLVGSAREEVPAPAAVRAGSVGLDELEILLRARVRALGAAAIDTDLRPIVGDSTIVRWAVRTFFKMRMAPRIVKEARQKVAAELQRFENP